MMPNDTFVVDVARVADVVRMRVAGDVDATSAPTLSATLQQIAAEPDRGCAARLEVDLTAVTFLSATALRALHTAGQATPQPVILIGVSRPVRRLLTALDLQRDFQLAPAA